MLRWKTRSVNRAAGAALIAMFAGAAAAQDVTLTRIIGEGDSLPNGWPWGGGGLAAIDGDRIAFTASTAEGDAVCVYDIPTGELRIIADTTMRSPTYPDNDFKSIGNPTISGDDVVFPGAALFFTNEWEGLYRAPADGSAGVSVVIDEKYPGVRIPSLPILSEAGVIYRDRGYAAEPVGFSTLGGAFEWVAGGDPAPGGGRFFDFKPPTLGGQLGAFWGTVSTATDNLWAAFTWRADTGELAQIAREGDPMPGEPTTFAIIAAHDSDGQQVLVNGWDDDFPRPYMAVYAWDGAALEVLVETGEPIPEGGGAVFTFLGGDAIDGDGMIFTGRDTTAEIGGLYGRFGGSTLEILSIDAILDGQQIRNFHVTQRSLSGNRVLINVGFNPLGADAIYLAEIDAGCRADLDGDGALTFFDFLAFQSFFAAGDLTADFDGSGDLDFFDFLAFQDEFAAGCP